MSEADAFLLSLADSLTEAQLRFIATRDYGIDEEKHLTALRELLGPQRCRLGSEQFWYPYEVVELCAHDLTPGHECEFTLCTLLVLDAVHAGVDTASDPRMKFENCAASYDALPSSMRDAILAAYLRLDC